MPTKELHVTLLPSKIASQLRVGIIATLAKERDSSVLPPAGNDSNQIVLGQLDGYAPQPIVNRLHGHNATRVAGLDPATEPEVLVVGNVDDDLVHGVLHTVGRGL